MWKNPIVWVAVLRVLRYVIDLLLGNGGAKELAKLSEELSKAQKEQPK